MIRIFSKPKKLGENMRISNSSSPFKKMNFRHLKRHNNAHQVSGVNRMESIFLIFPFLGCGKVPLVSSILI